LAGLWDGDAGFVHGNKKSYKKCWMAMMKSLKVGKMVAKIGDWD